MDLDKKTVLIIEDNKDLLKFLAMGLRKAGFHVLTTREGKEGLNLALNDNPDIVLLDIKMPKMDGLELLTELREDQDFGAKVPVIILTNLDKSDKGMISNIQETQPAYCLIKANSSIEEIIEKINELI